MDTVQKHNAQLYIIYNKEPFTCTLDGIHMQVSQGDFNTH